MERNRVRLLVEVDLDPMPGAMHTKQSAEESIFSVLYRSFPHYNPTVSLAPQELQPKSQEEIKENK